MWGKRNLFLLLIDKQSNVASVVMQKGILNPNAWWKNPSYILYQI